MQEAIRIPVVDDHGNGATLEINHEDNAVDAYIVDSSGIRLSHLFRCDWRNLADAMERMLAIWPKKED